MSKQQEILLSAVWEASADAMRITDSNGKVLNVNDAYCSLTGLEKKDIIGKPFVIVYDKKEQFRLQDYHLKFITGEKKTERSNKKVKLAGGRESIIEASYSQIEILGEKYVLAIIRDISEYTKAIEELKYTHKELIDSEEKYRQLVENSPDAIAIYVEGKIVFANKECIRLMAAKNEDELIGKPVIQFVHPDFRELVAERMNKAMKGGNVLQFNEEKFIKLDGSEVDVEVKAVPVKLNNKPAVQLIVRDITERKLTANVMKENEKLYQTLFELSPTGIIILDEKGIILETNCALSGILQYTQEELKGMSVRDLSFPERYNQIGKDIKTILSGKNLEIEIENIRKDGSVCIIELRERAITLKNGEPGILATVNDITLRKQAQEAEISVREQIKIILDLVPSYIFAKDYDGKFIMVNKSLADLFGVSPEEVAGKTDVDYGASKEQIKGYLTADREVIDSGKEIFIKEEQVLRKDGSLGWFQTHKIPYHHPGINKPAILGVAVDITERKHAEDVLQESESRYRELIDLAVDGILLGSNDGVIIDANKSMCDILGMSKESFIGKHITYLPFKDESVDRNPFRFDLLNKGEIVLTERTLIRPDGKEIIVEMRSKMMPDGSYQSIYRNITNRKLEEQEIKSKNAELTKLNNEKDKFFSIIAHDLRNPFQGFLGYTNLLRTNINKLTLNELKDIANDLNINAQTLFELLTNLLEWSMMQRGLTAFNPEKIQVKNLVADILILFAETAKQKGIIIKEVIHEDIFAIADKSMLSNVLRNLVSNAIKFTNKEGNVTLSASKSGNYVLINVKDTGIGMNGTIISNLFKIDKQTNRKGTDDEPSTGLGLLLCKEYIEKHNGKIIVESEEGKGSEFIISFPVV